MTKFEELARNLHNKWPYNTEAELQAEIRTALKPLLDAGGEVGRIFGKDPTIYTELEWELITKFEQQLMQWRKK